MSVFLLWHKKSKRIITVIASSCLRPCTYPITALMDVCIVLTIAKIKLFREKNSRRKKLPLRYEHFKIKAISAWQLNWVKTLSITLLNTCLRVLRQFIRSSIRMGLSGALTSTSQQQRSRIIASLKKRRLVPTSCFKRPITKSAIWSCILRDQNMIMPIILRHMIVLWKRVLMMLD